MRPEAAFEVKHFYMVMYQCAMGESFWQKIHYDSAPRPQRPRFAHPNVYNLALLLYCTYFLTNCDIHFFTLLHGMHYPISG